MTASAGEVCGIGSCFAWFMSMPKQKLDTNSALPYTFFFFAELCSPYSAAGNLIHSIEMSLLSPALICLQQAVVLKPGISF